MRKFFKDSFMVTCDLLIQKINWLNRKTVWLLVLELADEDKQKKIILPFVKIAWLKVNGVFKLNVFILKKKNLIKTLENLFWIKSFGESLKRYSKQKTKNYCPRCIFNLKANFSNQLNAFLWYFTTRILIYLLFINSNLLLIILSQH